MRGKYNRIGLTISDYKYAFGKYKKAGPWIVRGYNENMSPVNIVAEYLSWMKANKVPIKRVRRVGLKTLQRGIQNDVNKVLLKWARKRMMPEARNWLTKRFPHTASAVRESEASYSAGAIPLYTQDDIKPGAGPIEYVGKIIAPGHEALWEKHQAELKKKG